MLNYNLTLSRIGAITVSPTGLESTCLVFASGLDLFLTHVAPSGKFDILNDDFNFAMLLLTLAALSVAVLFLNHITTASALKTMWA